MPIPDPTGVFLVLARIAGLVLTAPMFGHLLVPLRARIGLVMVLALALAPAVAAHVSPASGGFALAGLVVVESAVGAMLGIVAQLIFAGVQLGGQIAGIQIGFGLANLVDPQSHAQSTVIAEWHQLIALLVFLGLDVHHVLIQALIESFRVAPVGVARLGPDALRAVVAQAGELFGIGVRVAAPVLIVLLLTNGTLGVLQRTIPQLNVFVVGFPVNVGAGLIVLGAALPFTHRLLSTRFGELGPMLGGLLRALHG